LPDADFLYSLVTGSKLDYLLHHRGHTHTIIGALAGSLLMIVVCEAWMRWRHLTPTRQDRYALCGLALLTPLLHIAMDSTNTYGVHPFWPFDNGWHYGDAVFIMEPLFWVAVVPLLFALKTRLTRALIVATMIGAGAWLIALGLIPFAFGLLLSGVALAMLAAGYFLSPRAGLMVSVCTWAGITGLFILAHDIAQARTVAFSNTRYAAATTLNQILSPMPVNPVCWEVILVQAEGDRYVLRRAMLSLAPSWIPAAQCPSRRLNDTTTVPLVEVADAGADYWQWHGEYSMPRGHLSHLTATRCEAAAFMRFARAPWVSMIDGQWILGDMRYDRESELGFSEIALAPHEQCPAHAPLWTPPLGVTP
jgi:inner membrane protein